MIEHATEWLNAYLDGELHGLRLHQVEDHLTRCASCRADLESLQKLSKLLKSPPDETLKPVERFVSDLSLLINAGNLPRQAERDNGGIGPKVVWWLAPAVLLGAWGLVQALLTVSTLVSLAGTTGLLGSASAWLSIGSQHSPWFNTTMSVFGNNLGGSVRSFLDIWDGLGIFRSNLLTTLAWQAGIGLLYWAWMAVGWTRQRRSGQPPAFPRNPIHS